MADAKEVAAKEELEEDLEEAKEEKEKEAKEWKAYLGSILKSFCELYRYFDFRLFLVLRTQRETSGQS